MKLTDYFKEANRRDQNGLNVSRWHHQQVKQYHLYSSDMIKWLEMELLVGRKFKVNGKNEVHV